MCLEQEVIRHGAPTLAGIKTGNLFPLKTEEDIREDIRKINRTLSVKGLRLIPVRKTASGYLAYLYRPSFLSEDLTCPEAVCLLQEKGYTCDDAGHCLAQLIRRLCEDGDFPHEIGLFLGYPPSDVRNFMKDPYQGVKCVGCWKAYDHAEDAEKTFKKYKDCTAAYCRAMKRGKTLECLAVDTHSLRHAGHAHRSF